MVTVTPTRRLATSGSVLRYRIGAELPFEVRFPSVSYCLRLQSSEAAGRNELMAHDAEAGTWCRIGPAYPSPALLMEPLQVAGVVSLRG